MEMTPRANTLTCKAATNQLLYLASSLGFTKLNKQEKEIQTTTAMHPSALISISMKDQNSITVSWLEMNEMDGSNLLYITNESFIGGREEEMEGGRGGERKEGLIKEIGCTFFVD